MDTKMERRYYENTCFNGIATADKKIYFSAIDITINIWLQVFPEGDDTHSVTLVCAVALFNVHTI